MDLNEEHLHLGSYPVRSLVQREENNLVFFSPTLKTEQQALQIQHVL